MTWKTKRAATAVGVAVGVLAMAACADSTGPSAGVDDYEAGVVADIVSSVDETGPDPMALGWGFGDVAPADVSGSFTFERTVDCPGGGTTVVSGEHHSTFASDTRIVTMDWTASHVHDGCVFTLGDLTVTLDGSVETTGSASKQLPQTRDERPQLLSLEASRTGHLDWTSDQGTRSCDIALTQSYDPDTGMIHITGTVCGRDVDVSHAPGHFGDHRRRGGGHG